MLTFALLGIRDARCLITSYVTDSHMLVVLEGRRMCTKCAASSGHDVLDSGKSSRMRLRESVEETR